MEPLPGPVVGIAPDIEAADEIGAWSVWKILMAQVEAPLPVVPVAAVETDEGMADGDAGEEPMEGRVEVAREASAARAAAFRVGGTPR